MESLQSWPPEGQLICIEPVLLYKLFLCIHILPAYASGLIEWLFNAYQHKSKSAFGCQWGTPCSLQRMSWYMIITMFLIKTLALRLSVFLIHIFWSVLLHRHLSIFRNWHHGGSSYFRCYIKMSLFQSALNKWESSPKPNLSIKPSISERILEMNDAKTIDANTQCLTKPINSLLNRLEGLRHFFKNKNGLRFAHSYFRRNVLIPIL